MPSASRRGGPVHAASPTAAAQTASRSHLSGDSALASEVKRHVLAGERDAAVERFAILLANQQRRAARIAFQYLRDVHDADEAVQDAFLRVFTHIARYREDLPFEVWFTRILINRCLDVRKTRARRLRWTLPIEAAAPAPEPPDGSPSIEARLVSGARVQAIAAAVETLPERQRAVFILRHFGGHSPADVGRVLGLTESTVRVHLFRAIHRLRALLEREGP
ncbi:MAG: RNA polymerase sigma factor [Acidimicrobiia bacterium]|nr:RNA polymerase sigma factor [Acidimicrobiia bacterium]